MKTHTNITFKVKCIKPPNRTCTYKDVTVGNIYEGLWIDGDDVKLKEDDKGRKGYYYNTDIFEIMPFQTDLIILK